MFGLKRKFKNSRRGFIKREDGSPTVEAVLWLPLFMVIFGFMVDGATIFFGQAKMLRVVQDANRHMSVNRLQSATETQDYVVERLRRVGIAATATTTEPAPGVIATVAVATVGQLEILGTLTFLTSDSLEIAVAAEHINERWDG